MMMHQLGTDKVVALQIGGDAKQSPAAFGLATILAIGIV